MTTRDFKVFLEPDAEYGGYFVICPSIPGCYSQGKTVSEALSNNIYSRGDRSLP
jgi:predicted RNase H-like HicB family nuclease